MKITVHMLDDVTAEITFTPGWFARTFRRAQIRRGIAFRSDKTHYEYTDGRKKNAGTGWFWKTTRKWVGRDIEQYIEAPPVEELPAARIK